MRSVFGILIATMMLVLLPGQHRIAVGQTPAFDVSDAALVRLLPEFESRTVEVDGIRLHYVAGGKGPPLVLLPGWPQTWWSYHKIMPRLAESFHVIAVDIRGMGGSSRPAGGYDKKTMAKDIYGLVRALGFEQANMLGHDIGAQVAYAYAANYPQATTALVMLDIPHSDESLKSWPLLPKHGTFGDKIDDDNAYAWWFAFHQVKGLPEKLLEGRVHIEQEWFFHYLTKDDRSIDSLSRAVYAAAYGSSDGVRAGNAWYQAFTQDIIDDNTYSKLEMPVLALAGPGYNWMKAVLTRKATDLRLIKVADSGHFIVEEQPDATVRYLLEFLKR